MIRPTSRVSATAAARQIGCARSSVVSAARRLGLGEQILRGPLLLTANEVEQIRLAVRVGRPGNPEFGLVWKGRNRMKPEENRMKPDETGGVRRRAI